MRERRKNWNDIPRNKQPLFFSSSSLSIPEYSPVNAKAAEFHTRSEKIRLLLGGNQSGKSLTTAAEVIRLCRTHPGIVAWMCSGSFKMIGEALFPHYQNLLAPGEISQVIWLNYGQRIPAIIRLRNGSEIHAKSYDQGVYKFQAARVDVIQLDEQPRFQIYQECLARTAATNGRIIFSMTPLPGFSYVQRELWDKRGVSPYIWGERMSYRENRFIPDEQKQALISLYGKDELDRRVEGLFTTLSGLVFKELDPQVHFIEPFPIPADWRKIRSIDLGYVNAFVCLWIAQGEDDTLYIYQEHYQAQMLIHDHAEIIRRKDFDGLTGVHPQANNDDLIEASVSDHEAQTRAELDAAGIATIPAQKSDKLLAIERVNRRLKVRANGRAGLYIFRSCAHTCEEWQGWRYKEPNEKSNVPEEPIKLNDHTCDAGIYGAMYFEPGENSPLSGAGERVFRDDRYESVDVDALFGRYS